MKKETRKNLEKRLRDLEKEIRRLKISKAAPNFDYLTAKEVRDWLGCSENTLLNYAKRGILSPDYPNAKKKYKRENVERFMKGL